MRKQLSLGVMMIAAFVMGGELYKTDFSVNDLKQWTTVPEAASRVEEGNPVLSVAVQPGKLGKQMVKLPFDLTAYRNQPLRLTVDCRARKVSKPAQAWNGIKIMLHYKKDGRPVWRSLPGVWGDFDWTAKELSLIVPAGVEGGMVMLGLEGSSGEVSFRNLTIETLPVESIFPPVALPASFRCEYSPAVTAQPPLRGVMSPASLKNGDLEELSRWGANLIRWQIVRNWGKSGGERDLAEYSHWIDQKLEEIVRVLDKAQSLGLKVIVDLHSPPGGRNPEVALFHESRYMEAFLATWRKIAGRVKGHPALWGYDLLNEPMQTRPAKIDYLAAQYRAAQAIRAIDPETPIIIESNDWCSPQTFTYLTPLPLKNIFYQLHMYWPGGYTHQGVNNNWGVAGRNKLQGYPDGKYNRDSLRDHLRPVIEFQKKYGARIFVGEFSAVRWAPGADRYLTDCIAIFEENGWDWTYHAFREWSGWSVEHSDDPTVSGRVDTTARKQVLLEAFQKNKGKNAK